MKKYIQKKSVFFILLFVTALVYDTKAQVVIGPADDQDALPDPSASVCQLITIGTTLEFEQALNCSDELVVQFYLNASQALEGTSEDDFFRSGIFSFTFDQLGLYTFVCGGSSPDFIPGRSEICYNVVAEQDIPTLGEWGLIILFVSLLIFGLVMIRQSASKGLKVQ